MKTLTKIETGKDARGNKYQTSVFRDFSEMEPNNNVTSWTLTREDGVYTLVETVTEQIPEPGGGATQYPDIWSLDISTVSEPLETNPYFRDGMSAAEMANWMKWKQGREDAVDPKKSSNSVVQNLYARFSRGETDYLSPRIVLKHQKVYTVPPSLVGVGRAFNDVQGNPFSFSSQVNFLLTGATALQEGGTYRVTLEWLTSKPGKWDQLVYGG